MKKVNRRTDYEIMQILLDYCSTEISAEELKRKYFISSSSQLIYWFRKFVDPTVKKSTEMKGRKIDTERFRSKGETLEQENARLRKALEHAELRAEALEIMIDIAEKEFKIPIRKK